MLKRGKNILRGQSIMEFSFCMVVVLLMLYGTVMVFRWTGIDLAERRLAYERSLAADAFEDYGDCMVYNRNDPPACVPMEHPSCGVFYECCRCLEGSTQEDGPLKQLEPVFYEPVRMNAVWGDEYK